MHDGSVLIDGPPERSSRRGASPEPPPGDPSGGEAAHDLRLVLPANAHNVVLVRHVVTCMMESLRLPAQLINDIRLAVTEACTNVVRHAYSGHHGRLEVRIYRESPGAMTVVIADNGSGLKPRVDSDGLGLGLPLMAAVAHALEFEERRDSGSCIRMRFLLGDDA